MLRVPTALTSASLPGLMWGSRASPGEGRVSVLLVACACLAASLMCFLVAVGLPGMGFSAGTPAGGWVASGVLAEGGVVWSDAAGFSAGVVGDCADGF